MLKTRQEKARGNLELNTFIKEKLKLHKINCIYLGRLKSINMAPININNSQLDMKWKNTT